MAAKNGVPEQIGRMVRDHRKAAGLTQTELAHLAGVGKSTLFDIEKGKSTISLRSLLRVLEVLNIKIIWDSPLDRR